MTNHERTVAKDLADFLEAEGLQISFNINNDKIVLESVGADTRVNIEFWGDFESLRALLKP